MPSPDKYGSLGQPHPDWTTVLAELSTEITGLVLTVGDEGYQAEHTGFDLSVPQRPALVVGAATTDDVLSAVRFAGSQRLPVGVQATGHGPTVAANGALLINTRRLDAVEVDRVNRSARLGAGTLWHHAIAAAAPYGLTSSPSVGAISYTLGGGIGVLSRRFGFAADHVRAIEVITADGEHRRVTAHAHPDLFWAMRGAGSNFGVVTSMEVDLVTVPELYAGGLFFGGEDRADVLAAFASCASAAPDTLSLSVAVLTFPDLTVLPPMLRGRHCCHVRVTHQGPGEEAEGYLGALRDTGPVLLDTVGPLPLTETGTIHNDPTTPIEGHSHSLVLRTIESDLIDAVVAHTGPAARSLVELRHLAGALSRPPLVANAVGHRNGAANLFTTAYPGGDKVSVEAEQRRLLADVKPWSDGGALANFLLGSRVTSADVRAAYRPEDYERLRELKNIWDPNNVFRFNNNIPPGD